MFALTFLTFISSGSLLFEPLSFHLPTNGLSAALNEVVIRDATSSNCNSGEFEVTTERFPAGGSATNDNTVSFYIALL